MKNKFNQFVSVIKRFFKKEEQKKFTVSYPPYCERDDWSINYGDGHE
jgi:hypothetical protein